MALVAGFVLFAVLDPPLGVIALALGAIFEIGEAVFWWRYLKRIRVRTGAEGLIGQRASVIEDCDPHGRVKVYGEIWSASAAGATPLGVGEEVRVASVDGLTLTVGRPPGPRPDDD